MEKKWGLIIDITRCDGCGSCMLSVKDEYDGNSYPGYCEKVPDSTFLLSLKEVVQGQNYKMNMDYIPVMFPHDRNFDPKSIPGIPEGAIYVREDGLTVIDPEKSKGCRQIYEYFKDTGAIFWNDELDIPQIYTLDSHRLDEGEKLPRCVEDCPTQAMHWGDLNDPESDVSKWMAEHPDALLEDYCAVGEGSDCVVKYYKLPKPFIAGEVTNADGSECLEGVRVMCTDKESGECIITETDFMGDFWFKYLKKDGDYTVHVDGCPEIEVHLDMAKNLEDIAVPEKVKEEDRIPVPVRNTEEE